MATPAFPSFTKVLGWSEEMQKSVVKTPMEGGIHKQRNRYFGRTFLIQKVALLMSQAEYIAFRTWWSDDAKHGALFFTITDPNVGGTVTARMVEGQFTASHLNPRRQNFWVVEFNMEQLF